MNISPTPSAMVASSPVIDKALAAFTTASTSLAFNENGKMPGRESISEAISSAQAGIDLLAPLSSSPDQAVRDAASQASKLAEGAIPPLKELAADPFYTRSIFSPGTIKAAQKDLDTAASTLLNM